MKENVFLTNRFVLIVFVFTFFSCHQEKKNTNNQPETIGKIPKQPNIVFILADDLGYPNTSTYGNQSGVSTPSIDALAAEGVKCMSGYAAAPVCCPSRAALLTGRNQQRFGFEYNITPTEREIRLHLGLPDTETTLAQELKKVGYNTALFGKWHLGSNPEFNPTERGFDEFCGVLAGATQFIDPGPDVESYIEPDPERRKGSWHTQGKHGGEGAFGKNVDSKEYLRRITYGVIKDYRDKNYAVYEKKEIVNEEGYLTDVFTNRGLDFIEKNKDDPFFLYLPYTAPHVPLQALKQHTEKFKHIEDEGTRIYSAMIYSLDENIGRIIAKLKELGLEENTIVIFASDNGCATYTGACNNDPFLGGKFAQFEGGIRVPYIIKWPGKVPAGKIYSYPVSLMDIFPTVMNAVGATMQEGKKYDGVDLVPYLKGENTEEPHRVLCWRAGYMKSVRKGKWKLFISEKQNFEYLFDLESDVSENNNVADQYPEIIVELKKDLVEWEKEMGEPAWPSQRSLEMEIGGKNYYLPI